MSGYQKRITLKQIEGWPDTDNTTLIERLDNLDSDRLTYEFTQDIESEVWQVTHSLGFKHPAVRIIDKQGNTIIGDINYMTNNYLEIEFTVATAGIAYIKK